MPTRKPSPDKPTRAAAERKRSATYPARATRSPLAGKAPLGSLPAEGGQSAASPAEHTYAVGDLVFWGTPTTAGEYIFIGHPKGDKAGNVLVLAHSAEVGFEVDADECSPTDRSNPQRGREYRQRYFRTNPGGVLASLPWK
jgi:hypothetical protein